MILLMLFGVVAPGGFLMIMGMRAYDEHSHRLDAKARGVPYVKPRFGVDYGTRNPLARRRQVGHIGLAGGQGASRGTGPSPAPRAARSRPFSAPGKKRAGTGSWDCPECKRTFQGPGPTGWDAHMQRCFSREYRKYRAARS